VDVVYQHKNKVMGMSQCVTTYTLNHSKMVCWLKLLSQVPKNPPKTNKQTTLGAHAAKISGWFKFFPL